MRKKILFLLRVLHGVLIVLGLLPGLAALPLALTQGYDMASQFPRAFAVFIPFFVSLAAALRCSSFFVFLPVSLAAFVLMLLIPMNAALKVLIGMLAAWIILVRILWRSREESRDYDLLMSPSLLTFILFVGLYILGAISGVTVVRDVNYVLAFLYVILYLVFRNLTNLENYLEVNSTVENIPKKQIARTNTGALLLTVAAAVLFMLLFPLLGIDKLLAGLKDAFIALLRLIFSGIETTTETPAPEPTQAPEIGPGNFMPDGETLPDWALAIFAVIRTVLIILTAAFVLYLVGYGLYSLIKRFYRPYRDNQDVQEFIRDDPDVKESLFRETLLRRLPFLDPSPNGAVRRIYRKTIEKGLFAGKASDGDGKETGGKPRGSLASLSPAELEDAAMLEKDERRALLHETYEKARYSEEPVTREDLKKLKG